MNRKIKVGRSKLGMWWADCQCCPLLEGWHSGPTHAEALVWAIEHAETAHARPKMFIEAVWK